MVIQVFVLFAAVALVSGGTLKPEERISIDVAEDAKLDTAGLITKYGYPNEVHTITTEDDYILTMHRIPHLQGQDPQQNRPVVFLMHGLLSSSADWVNMGPGSGFGYLLADEGFDVWMGNARGNTYSRKHATLDPDKDSKYWKFSWNEIGYYDLPAMIDYILAKTGKTQLHYSGHSQGTTSFFVMCALRKEYNAKIKSMHALAPVGYMSHLKSPLVKLLSPIANTAELLSSLIGVNELLPSTELMSIAGELLCKDNSIFQPVCSNILFLICGFDPELLNTTMLPIMLAHTPAGSSSRQMVHYGQEHQSAKFRKYDFGSVLNLVEYGKLNPPDYELKDVTAPVTLHYAVNDWMAEPVDVLQLYGELGNADGMYKINHPSFNHLDFLWAIDVRSLVYDNVIRLMKGKE